VIPNVLGYNLRGPFHRWLQSIRYANPMRVDISFGEATTKCFAHTLQFIAENILHGTPHGDVWPYKLGVVQLCGFNVEEHAPSTSTSEESQDMKSSLAMIKSVMEIWDRQKKIHAYFPPIPVTSLFIAISRSVVIRVDDTIRNGDLSNYPIIAQIAIQLFKPQ
jgi:hypothetical protein